jgi:hypothetical protein
MPHLGEHLDRIATGHADRALDGRHVGPQERVGGFLIFQRRFAASASTGPATAGSTTPMAPLWGSRINHT